MARVEKKFYDFNLGLDPLITDGSEMTKSNGTIGGTLNSTTLCDIKQGTGEQERIGRKCTITNIYMKLSFRWLVNSASIALSSAAMDEVVRVIIYWDKQCNGAAASNDDILADDIYNAYRDLSNIKRFRILYDKTKTWTTPGLPDGISDNIARVQKTYEVKIAKKVFIPIEYDSVTGAITEIKSNNIGLLVWTKHGGRMKMEQGSQVRLRFIDM